jgi:hypothetical protein
LLDTFKKAETEDEVQASALVIKEYFEENPDVRKLYLKFYVEICQIVEPWSEEYKKVVLDETR